MGLYTMLCLSKIGMQVQIRTNLLEFEFAPNLYEFVDPSEFKFATSNLRIRIPP